MRIVKIMQFTVLAMMSLCIHVLDVERKRVSPSLFDPKGNTFKCACACASSVTSDVNKS